MAETSKPIRDYSDSRAAKMLADGLRTAAVEKKLSLRAIGRGLGYRQPVVLSHMASGRVPVPIDRAVDIARAAGLPEREFLLACLEQRYTSVDWSLVRGHEDDFAHELSALAGRSLDDLGPEHRWVIREVVAEPQPSRRWLKVAELPTVELIRELRPSFSTAGLGGLDRRAVRQALTD
jgi:hypothetical protein